MGTCLYCGKKVGIFRKYHSECKKKFKEGKQKIIDYIYTESKNNNFDNIVKIVDIITKENFIDNNTKKESIIKGWEYAVKKAFDDGILSEQEEKNLTSVITKFSLNQTDLDKNGYYTKLIQGKALREIMNGILPDVIDIDKTSLPFNFQKKEEVIWVFYNVDYYEQKTRRQYQGGSKGVSIRIAKGLYYRVGAFKGETISYTETIHADNGLMVITNKHIYFSGSNKSFRINFNKIVSFQAYEDGIGVQKDGVTAKPIIFKNNQGWFTYNLLSNISNID